MNTPDVIVWLWENAPFEYKKLSGHGGDEDYIIKVKTSLYEYDYKLERILNGLTVCDYEQYVKIIDGESYYIFITSHA